MNITIYCAASLGNQAIYADETVKLAEWMVANNYHLVYGGGKVGLMGIIADTILSYNGEVTGVIPSFLAEREIAHPNLSELIVVDSMTERKAKMMELADVFIALPGGPGTLEEISEVISWARIGKNDKPCILYNVNGYYNPLRNLFDQMVTEGFLSQTDREAVLFSDDLQQIEMFIRDYQAPGVGRY